MANTRELRRRIKSVKNTAQITKAMQMVAATKMRRAQNQAISGRPYNENLDSATLKLLLKTDVSGQPLAAEALEGKVGVIVLSTDKGLCGALNTNIFKTIQSFSKEKSDLVFYTLGKKGRQFLVKLGKGLEADFENPESVTFRQAKQLSKLVTGEFLGKKLKEVYIIYPNFVSSLRQESRVERLLPVRAEDIKFGIGDLTDKPSKSIPGHNYPAAELEFVFEPDASGLLDFVLNHYVEIKIYQALLETKASEHSARMIAMQSATDNAKELVQDLELSYNQTRQAAITNEILEITTAQAALE